MGSYDMNNEGRNELGVTQDTANGVSRTETKIHNSNKSTQKVTRSCILPTRMASTSHPMAGI